MSGLKLYPSLRSFYALFVSPYIGEWIEIVKDAGNKAISQIVSPYIGEWIEIIQKEKSNCLEKVSPYIGEWIEMCS